MRTAWLSLLLIAGACTDGKGDSIVEDQDGDGYASTEDCDDANAAVHPDANEIWYDGVDSDCAGNDDNDQDGDGAEALAMGGTDCDDEQATVHPGVTETCDGIDNNCDGTVDEGLGSTFYQDADGDGFGNVDVSQLSCLEPAGYVSNPDDCNDADPRFSPNATEDCSSTVDYNCDGQVGSADHDGDGFSACEECDDGDASIHPGAAEHCDGQDEDCNGAADDDPVDGTVWYADGDGDGYGQDGVTTRACSQPSGYAAASGDCKDSDPGTNPGIIESCSDTVDSNCDGSVGSEDRDGDGYPACEECNDGDPTINPGGTEVCDGRDNNCDSAVDVGAADATLWYGDADGDGYGDPASGSLACSAPVGTISVGGDCVDTDATVHPGVVESCDGIDNDCSGSVDDMPVDGVVYYADLDADGYGNAADSILACAGTGIYTASNAADCDDSSATALPGGSEVCDGLDNDCNGVVDDNAVGTYVFYLDGDGDGYGDAGVTSLGCTAPYRYVANADDCNDLSASVSPAASEVCNGVDDDCSGNVDDNIANPPSWYTDADGDGYGSGNATVGCTQPSGTVRVSGDCDDGSAAKNPGAAEICDNLDNDCDGMVDNNPTDGDPWYTDADGDGFGNGSTQTISCTRPSGAVANGSDCDDGSVSITDGADYYADLDGDGYGDPATILRACSAPRTYISVGGDCDDNAAAANPAGAEVCDALDNDCNGAVDDNPSDGSIYYADADADGFGDATSPENLCGLEAGTSVDNTDCDDGNGTTYPGASEVDNGVDDDCDSYVDEDFLNVGDVIFTEVTRQPYVNGSATNNDAAWFEIYNTTSRTIDLSNWYVGRVSSTVASKGITIDPLAGLVLGPNSYVTFCKTSKYQTPQTGMGNIPYPLGCDYVWGETTDSWHSTTLNLQRDEDDLYLYVEGNSSTGWLMDEVHWYYDSTNGFWPRQSQASMSLDPAHLNSSDNDSLSYWCYTTVTASNTFGKDGNYRWWDDTTKSTDEYGTPGAGNYDCPSIN